MRNIKNDPAFPVKNSNEYMSGLSKREYFAAKALQSLTVRHNTETYFPYTEAAQRAVEYADALIEALNK